MEYHMLLKELQYYVHLFSLVSVGYLMTLSMSIKYMVQDIINEYGAWRYKNLQEKQKYLKKNSPYWHFVPNKSQMTWSWTWAAAVETRRLLTWAMAQPAHGSDKIHVLLTAQIIWQQGNKFTSEQEVLERTWHLLCFRYDLSIRCAK
jgi:hypothetical protein